MKDMGIIQGSEKQAVPIVIGKDTVYIHSGIVQISENLYEYSEIQYDKDEYLTIMAQNNKNLTTQTSATDDALLFLLTELMPTVMG